jgi:hypothetical protein
MCVRPLWTSLIRCRRGFRRDRQWKANHSMWATTMQQDGRGVLSLRRPLNRLTFVLRGPLIAVHQQVVSSALLLSIDHSIHYRRSLPSSCLGPMISYKMEMVQANNRRSLRRPNRSFLPTIRREIPCCRHLHRRPRRRHLERLIHLLVPLQQNCGRLYPKRTKRNTFTEQIL